MKECWINVYKIKGQQILGKKFETRKGCDLDRGINCIGIIHVKLKEQKPKFNKTGIGYKEFIGD